jgi:hypothetical protein
MLGLRQYEDVPVIDRRVARKRAGFIAADRALPLPHMRRRPDVRLDSGPARRLTRLMQGSVADKVVRGAHAPVLVQRSCEPE